MNTLVLLRESFKLLMLPIHGQLCWMPSFSRSLIPRSVVVIVSNAFFFFLILLLLLVAYFIMQTFASDDATCSGKSNPFRGSLRRDSRSILGSLLVPPLASFFRAVFCPALLCVRVPILRKIFTPPHAPDFRKFRRKKPFCIFPLRAP